MLLSKWEMDLGNVVPPIEGATLQTESAPHIAIVGFAGDSWVARSIFT